MSSSASEIARRLAENAEAVCRHYLSNGRREGQYWMVGDVRNSPGRSLYVRLATHGEGGGAQGKWTDAASGDHGDLLDIIAASCGHVAFRETLDEARRFLSLPPPPDAPRNRAPAKASAGTPEAARRLWGASKPLIGSLAADYLSSRFIANLDGTEALRFHPHCFYRPCAADAPDTRTAWPAMIAAVTDDAGRITGAHRTWLCRDGSAKASVAYPRRAMGHLLGHGVRFGVAGPVMVFGEGIETLLSLRQILTAVPMIAGLSSAHLAAILFPAGLRRLYVARDDDAAGAASHASLAERAGPLAIEVIALEPRHGDFNSDLQAFGVLRLEASLRRQLDPRDRLDYL